MKINEEIKSRIFDWNKLSKNQLIHLLTMMEKMGFKEEIFKVLNETQYGIDYCKTCKSIHKKDYFINFSKESSIPIHSFIFSHYKGQTDNDPSSMATFEKKLRSIVSTIKDEFVKKSPESRRNRMINVLWNIIYPIKTLIAIVTKSGKLRNIVNLIFFPISWPFSLIKSLFILFGKQSYILLV